MKYFLISKDEIFNRAPDIINWYEDERLINEKNLNLLENRKILKIRNEENIIWTDIISNPNFFVSEKVKEVINKYDNKIKFKQIILLDIIGAKAEVYYLPILKFIKCLSEESEIFGNKIKKCVIKKEIIKDEKIFRIGDVNKRYIVARLDLVESILRRGARGLHLERVEVI
ncbi:MAG: imm11 family protein [Lachnospirales bacterium]|nr:hypothetical protein [Clostridiales bacterium]